MDPRWCRVVREAPVALVLVGSDLSILAASRAALELLGVPSAELLVGRNVRTLPLYSLRSVADALDRTLGAGEETSGEIAVTTAWGKAVDVTVRLAPHRDEQGKIVGAHVLIHDVGERHRLEKGLRKVHQLRTEAHAANQLVHDVRNYLSVIEMYAEMIRQNPGDEKAAARSGEIAQLARDAALLVGSALETGRAGASEPDPIDLNARLRVFAEMLRSAWGGAIRVELRLEEGLDRLSLEPTLLDQIVLNLVLNARDAMPGGGDLVIETRSTSGDARPGPGRYVVLSVSDSGTGMSRDVQARIFERYFTTKPRGAGFGLGLSLVHEAVSERGGEVRVTSEPGRGTRFDVCLPVPDPA